VNNEKETGIISMKISADQSRSRAARATIISFRWYGMNFSVGGNTPLEYQIIIIIITNILRGMLRKIQQLLGS